MTPIYGFYHVACMNGWEDVVEEQHTILEESGLLDMSRRIYGTVLGGGRPDCLDHHRYVLQHSPDLLLFEFPTLARLRLMAEQEPEFYAFYYHTKGVRLGSPPEIADWRHLMNHFILERWPEAITKLEAGYDCVGCTPGRMPWAPPQDWFHYSGNFWWARSSFLRRLPLVGTLNTAHRELAEAWIGMAGEPHAYTAFTSPRSHTDRVLPEEYRGKGY